MLPQQCMGFSRGSIRWHDEGKHDHLRMRFIRLSITVKNSKLHLMVQDNLPRRAQ